MKPLKILQVSTTDWGGGAEGSAWNLFQAYRSRGHSSWLAVGRKFSDDPDVIEIPRTSQHPLWTRLCWAAHGRLSPLEDRLPGVRRIRAGLRILAGGRPSIERWLGQESFHFPGTWRLLKLTPQQPDIVHLHNLHGDYFDLRYLPFLSRQVPVVLNLRDMWLLTGHCAYSIGCQRWKTGCGNCPDLTIYPAIGRDATAYNWRRKQTIYAKSRLYITTPSQWLMNQVQESMLRGVECRVIPNAIDLTVFQPGSQMEAREKLGLAENARIVLLSAHNPFKDYNLMETALGQLVGDNKHDLIFICLGRNGPPRRLGQGYINYLGFERDPHKVALYYRAANVFVHAAKDEVFGKTIAESMACGTPVAATAVGGIPEIIRDGETGFLTPPGDPAAMANCVQRLLDDASLRERMGRQAAEDAGRRFNLKRQVNDFLAWYYEILERERSHALPNPE